MRRYSLVSLAVVSLTMLPNISLGQTFVYNGEGGDTAVIDFAISGASLVNNATLAGVRSPTYNVNSITNNGDILGFDPIFLSKDLTTFINAGTVFSSTGGAVIVGGIINSFTNTGTISTSANNTPAVQAMGINTFVNSGTIRGATGVNLSSSTTDTHFTNSGTIESTLANGVAIIFGSGNDTLVLQTGSQITGGVLFRDGSDTLNFSGFGGSATLDVEGLFGETLIAGDNLYAWNGQNQIAITQRPSTSSVGTVSSNVATDINNVIVEQINTVGVDIGDVASVGDIGGSDTADTDLLGYAPGRQKTDAETAVLSLVDIGTTIKKKTTKWWTKLFGGVSRDTAPTDVHSVFGSGLTGGHVQLNDRTVAGGFVGVAGSDINAGGTQNLKAVTGVVGAYSRYDATFAALDISLMGGFSGHDSKRDVTIVGGTETAAASFTSWFVSPSLGITVPVLDTGAGTVKIATKVSYTGGQVTGYTETGSNQNLTVGNTPISVLTAKLGLEGALELMRTQKGAVMLTGSIGGLVQSNLGGSTTAVTILGTTQNSVTAGQTNYGLYAGTGLKAPTSANTHLGIGLDVQTRNDGYYSATGSASITGAF